MYLLQRKSFFKSNDCRHQLGAFAVLSCYVALVGSGLPTFRDDLSFPTSRTN